MAISLTTESSPPDSGAMFRPLKWQFTWGPFVTTDNVIMQNRLAIDVGASVSDFSVGMQIFFHEDDGFPGTLGTGRDRFRVFAIDGNWLILDVSEDDVTPDSATYNFLNISPIEFNVLGENLNKPEKSLGILRVRTDVDGVYNVDVHSLLLGYVVFDPPQIGSTDDNMQVRYWLEWDSGNESTSKKNAWYSTFNNIDTFVDADKTSNNDRVYLFNDTEGNGLPVVFSKLITDGSDNPLLENLTPSSARVHPLTIAENGVEDAVYLVGDSWQTVLDTPVNEEFTTVTPDPLPEGVTLEKQALPELTWQSVAERPSDGRLIAVSDDQSFYGLMFSDDGGQTWETMLSPTDSQRLFDITWSANDNQFVAVSGDSGGIVGSGEAGQWSTFSMPSGDYRGVAYAPDKAIYVAVGVSGIVATSSNGTSWTAQSSGNSLSWRSVTYSEPLGLFVACAANGGGDGIMTSPDGTTWTHRSIPDLSFREVRWLQDTAKFWAVAVFDNAPLYESNDGINWSNTSTPSFNVGITVTSNGQGRMWVLGSSGSSGLFSPDFGINWEAQSVPSGNWRSLIWSDTDDNFVTVGLDTSNPGQLAMFNDGDGFQYASTPQDQEITAINFDDMPRDGFEGNIQLDFSGDSEFLYRVILSEIATQDTIQLGCPTRFNIAWVNQNGGWSSYVFDTRFTTGFEIGEERFSKVPGDPNVLNRNSLEEVFRWDEVTSGVVSREVIEFLTTLRFSVEAYLYNASSGNWDIPIVIDTGSGFQEYEHPFKEFENEFTFRFRLAREQVMQIR